MTKTSVFPGWWPGRPANCAGTRSELCPGLRARGDGRLPRRQVLPASPSGGEARAAGTDARRRRGPGAPGLGPGGPRALTRERRSRAPGAPASSPTGAGPRGPSLSPRPPAPQQRRRGARRQARSGPVPALLCAPGPAVGAARSPAGVRLQADAAAAPVHLGAGPAGHGALRRPPSAPRPGRSGHGAGTQRPAGAPGGARGGTRKRRARRRAPGARVRPTPRNLRGGLGGTGGRPAGAREGRARSPGVRPRTGGGGVRTWPTRGPAGGQSAGRAVPGRGRWHLRPMRARRGRHLGQSPGVPAPATQWLGAGGLPVGRGAAHLRPMGARAARLCPATGGGARCAPRAGPSRSGLPGPRSPGGAPAPQRPGNLLETQAVVGAAAPTHRIETPAVRVDKPRVIRRRAQVRRRGPGDRGKGSPETRGARVENPACVPGKVPAPAALLPLRNP